jgi:methylenetetrahydrofolate dehydrogenase (NADP+) / methenyltetrahydrofolate cyclohydrolase
MTTEHSTASAQPGSPDPAAAGAGRTARLMVGTEIAVGIAEAAAERVKALHAATGMQPCLAAVLVGDDPASATYVRMKQNRSRRAGIASLNVVLPTETTTEELVVRLRDLSEDPTVHGILLQHPVPAQIDERAAFEAIAPAKDVDGVTMHNFAAMAFEAPGFHSCTAEGILRLLHAYGVQLSGAHAVVIGRSPILGKPVGMLLLAANATVTYCHSRTRNLADIVATADIVVAAVGKPRFVRGSWLKPGAAVVDAGYNEGNVGDVEFDEAVQVAGLLTPVPGGVGPMTIALRLEQTVAAAEAQSETPNQTVSPLT